MPINNREEISFDTLQDQFNDPMLQAHVMEFVELSADAIISADTDQCITLFNQAAQDMFGYDMSEVLGKSLDILIPQAFVDVHRQHMQAFSEQPSVFRRMAERQHIRGRRSDGSEFPAEASILKSHLDDRFSFTVVMRDITKRELAEVALRESEKAEHELQIARNIQASFLPSTLPNAPGWEIDARFHPAKEVAGDFYDAFTLSGGRRIGFIMADVVDKGVPAALFMSLCRSLLRAFSQQHYSVSWSGVFDDTLPGQRRRGKQKGRERVIPTTGTLALKNAVELTNKFILDNHMELNMFATMFFGMIDPATGSLAYINAGHNPPFIVGVGGEVKAALKSTGPAVGMFPGADFNIETARFDPGDVLYAYTDGVTERAEHHGRILWRRATHGSDYQTHPIRCKSPGSRRIKSGRLCRTGRAIR